MKRILIYSRKSKFTGKGDSIENQIELCKEHAKYQFGANVEFFVYEDEGYSGKNTIRPEFQRMMSDMRLGGYDVLMCYRLDRISRSVSDFSYVLEELQAHGVDFVSIREQFDTSTPMGRAMIHIAAVFAELERETIAERVRDNKYHQYRNGHWQGGIPPLGYTSKKVSFVDESGASRSYQTLEIEPEDAAMARMIFDKYIAIGSYSKLESYLVCNHIKTPQGNDFTKCRLRLMLANPVYAINTPCVYDYLQSRGADMANDREEYDGTKGVIAYGKTVTKNPKLGNRKWVGPEEWVVAVADHQGIIDGEKWVYVQTMSDNKSSQYPRTNTSVLALLSTLIRCSRCGSPMEPSGQRKYADGSPGFYYICAKKRVSRGTQCDCPNIKGVDFDNAIIQAIKEALEDKGQIKGGLTQEIRRVHAEQRDHGRAISKMESKLTANGKALKRLAMKLADSDTPDADALIYEAMRALQEEEKHISQELSIAKQRAAAAKNSEMSFDIIQEAFDTFAEKVNEMNNEEKKEALRKLVQKIEWDGKNAMIQLASLPSGIKLCGIK